MATYPLQTRRSSSTPRARHCNDHVVGAILSGWRYDISGISPDLRVDYEDHLRACDHCRGKQRLHRTVDLLLFAVTALSCAAFLLAALVLHRIRTYSHLGMVHVHLRPEANLIHSHIPASVAVSLQAVALLGVFVSMLLWVLVAIATPVPGMVSEMLRLRAVTNGRDRLDKQAA